MSFAKVGKFVFLVMIMAMLASPFVNGARDGTEINNFESLSDVIITGSQRITDDDAVLLRYGMDLLGNNDSAVSSSEVTDFENAYEDYVKEFGNEYTLNGIEGTFTGLVTTFKDAEGAVSATTPIIYEYQGRLHFPGIDDNLEAYSFRVVNEGGDLNTTMTIQITVPDGYEITFVEGILAPVTSESGRTINGPTLTDTNVVIGFRPADEWSQYYTPLLISGVICAVVIALVAVSRYRSDVGEGEDADEPGSEEPASEESADPDGQEPNQQNEP